MAGKYLPLQLAEEAEEHRNTLNIFYENGWTKELQTLDEYTKYLFGGDFMSPDYQGPFQKINNAALNEGLYEHIYREVPEDIKNRMTDDDKRIDVLDILGYQALVLVWSEYKMVYKVNPDFFRELARTENIKFAENTFSYLPVQTMYIDLSECTEVDPIQGAFIHVVKRKGTNQFVVYLVTDDKTTFSFYSHFIYDESGIVDIDTGNVQDTAVDGNRQHEMKNMILDDDGSIVEIQDYCEKDTRYDAISGILQVLTFLSANNADITENPVTKTTYRPSQRIRNKFSEIRMWDVGVRYGNAIRRAKEAADREYEQEKKEEAKKPRGTHRSPRPHVRAAHWQRYHVGPGRKETRILWILPTIVCGGREIPITIHDIK